jgi:DNA processing protein
MTQETALLWSWLNVLTLKRYEALKSVYGTLDASVDHIDEQLLAGLGCRRDTIFKTLNRLEEFDLHAYAQALDKRGIACLSLEDTQYPTTLRSTDDPPVFLYYKGSLDILQQPCIALVGTRAMSSYGERVTEQFVSSFVQAGLVTVSGLALGIDTTVAKETLSSQGKSVAVLAQGLAQISPASNRRLADEIVATGGLLLSEYSLDQQPDKYAFPARNRIVAALSLATVVLEAPVGSGALITADLAFGYGREVFAVPSQIYDENYAGCHAIIQKGQAKLAASPAGVLKDIGIVAPSAKREDASAFAPQNTTESALWNVLSSMPQTVDDLLEKSAIETAALNATLTMLELRGVVRNVGNGWVRV